MHPVERDDYVMPTVAIERFVNVVLSWIKSNVVGALVPGLQRIGKTYAVAYFVKNYERWLNKTVGVVSCEVGFHKMITEKVFWGDLLRSMKRGTIKSTPEARRELFLGYLVEAGAKSVARKVVIFLDEAQRLNDELFNLLIGIHNDLWRIYRIKAAWILIGQPELEAFVATYVAQGKRQIVGRFMADTYYFEPLSGIEDFEAALRCYDESLQEPKGGPMFTEHFAPMPFAAGYRLHHDAKLICACVEKARTASGLPASGGMTMQGFTTLANYLLINHLPELKPGNHLTEAKIDDSIIATNCMIFEQQEALMSSVAPVASAA